MSRAQERLRILLACAPAPFGGLESVVAGLAAGLAGRGHEVHVAATLDRADEPHAVLDPLERAGVAVHRLAPPPRAYLAERRAIERLLGQLRPRVLHTHGYRADILAGWAGRRAGVPVVSTAHGFIGGDLRNRAYEWLQCRALRLADRVVAVSLPIRDRLRRAGVPEGRLVLLRNAFAGDPALSREEARAALGLPADMRVAGWIGRLAPEKGPDLLVEAARLAGPGIAWSVIGDGPMRDAVAARASAAVHFHGRLAGAGRLVSAFDVLVLSSRTEGTPIILLEAMAAGVPVVATAVGGVPDVLGPAEGWLVRPGDPAALAAAVREALGDRVEAARRAASASARLGREFGREAWLDAHERLYLELAGRPT